MKRYKPNPKKEMEIMKRYRLNLKKEMENLDGTKTKIITPNKEKKCPTCGQFEFEESSIYIFEQIRNILGRQRIGTKDLDTLDKDWNVLKSFKKATGDVLILRKKDYEHLRESFLERVMSFIKETGVELQTNEVGQMKDFIFEAEEVEIGEEVKIKKEEITIKE